MRAERWGGKGTKARRAVAAWRRYVLRILPMGALATTALMLHGCSSEAPDTTPPAQVTDLRVDAFTESIAVLFWTAPGGDGDRGQAAEYDLRVSVGTAAVEWTGAEPADAILPHPGAPGGTQWVPVRGLEAGQVYFLALRTADGAKNWSGFSNVVRVEPGDPAPPARVTNLQAVDLAPHAVTLVFTAPGDDSLSGWAEEYALRVSPTPITEETWEEAEAIPLIDPPQTTRSQEHIRITVLEPGTTVHLAIRARDDAGRWSDVSNDLEVTLPLDTMPPGSITDLTLVETGIFMATLRWTAPGNDGDEAKVDEYEIRYAESRIEDEAAWTAASLAQAADSIVDPGVMQTAVLMDLPGPKTLWFAVRPVDAAGQRGGLSNGVSGVVRRVPRTWVIRVDGTGDAPTVQAGIDSAVTTDTVLVHSGRYYENIRFHGKGIVVTGTDVETTILDGSTAAEATVQFRDGEGRDAVLQRLTITGGTGSSSIPGHQLGGGGVYVQSCEPTVRENRIVGNTVRGHGSYGGGIFCVGQFIDRRFSPRIVGNTIADNAAGSNGGGVGILGGMMAEVEGNVIENNSTVYGDGGGVWIIVFVLPPTLTLSSNIIRGNVAMDHGGGIYCGEENRPSHDVGVHIVRNVIAKNRAIATSYVSLSGGGLWLGQSKAWVHENTFVENNGFVNAWGGGVAVTLGSSPMIERNVIAYSPFGGAIRCEAGTSPTIRNNLVWKNKLDEEGGGCVGWLGQAGNLEADPLFCDRPSGDYSLAANSPALTHLAGPLGAFPTAGCAAVPPTATLGPIQESWYQPIWSSAH